MKHLTLFAAILVLAFSSTSCDRLDIPGMFWSHGERTDDRVARWLDYDEANGMPVITGAPDDYRIYVCSDIHITDSAPRFGAFLKAGDSDPLALFSILNGDIANTRGESPFRVAADTISRHSHPCFALLGNHDIYFDCQQYFEKYFHTSTYTVTVQTVGGHKDLFVFTDSGNATHGSRQTQWLKEVLSHREEYRHVVVATHTCLFRTSYNYSTTPAANFPEEEYYALLDLLSRHDVDLFLMGHFHHKEQHIIGNVQYAMTSNLNTDSEAPSYIVVDLSDDVRFAYHDLIP